MVSADWVRILYMSSLGDNLKYSLALSTTKNHAHVAAFCCRSHNDYSAGAALLMGSSVSGCYLFVQKWKMWKPILAVTKQI